MTLIEKFTGTVLSLKDLKAFIERAEVLGYSDKTPIGDAGKGIVLWIESPQGAEIYRCGENGCGKEFGFEQLARSYDAGTWRLPAHESHTRRGFPCAGSGKDGVATR